jgi:hypothetical protein
MQPPDRTLPQQPPVIPPSAGKAAYEQPVLVRYGDVRALTQAVGGHGQLDGGHRGLTPLRSQL